MSTRTGMKLRRPLIAALLALLTGVTCANAATIQRTYSYFSIGGTTLDEIQANLEKYGPHVESTGSRHPGATRIEFRSRIGYEQTTPSNNLGRLFFAAQNLNRLFDPGAFRDLYNASTHCRIRSADVTVAAKVILPRWRRNSAAASDVRLIWATLESDIGRHEESHVVIAKNHGRLLEEELRKVSGQPSCDAAAQKADEVTRRVLAMHEREQQRFDRIESKNFEKRLLNLLKYRLEQSAARRQPN